MGLLYLVAAAAASVSCEWTRPCGCSLHCVLFCAQTNQQQKNGFALIHISFFWNFLSDCLPFYTLLYSHNFKYELKYIILYMIYYNDIAGVKEFVKVSYLFKAVSEQELFFPLSFLNLTLCWFEMQLVSLFFFADVQPKKVRKVPPGLPSSVSHQTSYTLVTTEVLCASLKLDFGGTTLSVDWTELEQEKVALCNAGVADLWNNVFDRRHIRFVRLIYWRHKEIVMVSLLVLIEVSIVGVDCFFFLVWCHCVTVTVSVKV